MYVYVTASRRFGKREERRSVRGRQPAGYRPGDSARACSEYVTEARADPGQRLVVLERRGDPGQDEVQDSWRLRKTRTSCIANPADVPRRSREARTEARREFVARQNLVRPLRAMGRVRGCDARKESSQRERGRCGSVLERITADAR